MVIEFVKKTMIIIAKPKNNQIKLLNRVLLDFSPPTRKKNKASVATDVSLMRAYRYSSM